MSDQTPRPAPEGYDSWPAYWQAQGMPWRTEPEVDEGRQRFLAERRAVKPDIERGIYPFRGENGSIKLTRADVEWLLATHDGGRGPIRWSEERDKDEADRRWGLDLRGADLHAVNLSPLPLACLHAGLTREEWDAATPQQRELAAAHLERANLSWAHLQGAYLVEVTLQGADLREVELQGAFLYRAHLQEASLAEAVLHGAYLVEAELQGGRAYRAQLQGANLFQAQLQGANLTGARLDVATSLNDVALDAQTRVADVIWNGTPLTRIRWEQVPRLGDERVAHLPTSPDGKVKHRVTRLAEFHAAVRANRQLAVALRAQGLNEDADRFAYRAQVLHREMLRRQRRWGRAFGSWLLDMVSGYGYKPLRSFITYALFVVGFAVVYYLLRDSVTPALTPVDSLIFSITSFHGRGFSPGEVVTLHNPLTILAAVEAIIGLLIEITFIATFTQRFFAR